MSKFKVGDKIRVKWFKDYPNHWTNDMKDMSGNKVIITEKRKMAELPYKLNNCIFSWVESDFEEINEIKLLNDDLFKI